MGKYLHGKLQTLMTEQEFKEKIEAFLQKNPTLSVKKHRVLERLAYFTILFHTGARKSELYERLWQDIKATETHFIIDYGQRKKHGERVPALEIPRGKYGIEEYVLPYARLRWVKERMFPHMNAYTTWRWCKRIFGEDYYPHYFRLNFLTKVNRQFGDSGVKNVSGIKQMKAREAYKGIDPRLSREVMTNLQEVSE